MNNSVIVKNERKMSSMALFWVCVLTTVGIGLAISYSSGIFGGVQNAAGLPFRIPRWLVIAAPPVLFLHLGIALYAALNANIYSENLKMVRGWMWAFWITTFIATAITPFFIFYGMPVAAYIMSAITTGLALGTTLLVYRQSIGGGVVMTIFFIVVALIMVYLGYWAFA
ncbi:MAG: hypothetical protein HDT28_00305 [Clostridiales bacterium]|nr:hypothetical protein [Clostridiales bacterium]